MKSLSILVAALAIVSCAPSPKKLATVEYGMTKTEVVAIVGEPVKKNVVNKTEIWDYPDSARTIVFRQDTVYSIITSAKARVDSMGVWLDSTNQKVKTGFGKIGDGLEKAAGKLDDAADKLKNKLDRDTTKK